jgi:hypothetical protein
MRHALTKLGAIIDVTEGDRRKKGIRTLNTCRSRPTWRCRCKIGKINKNVISKCEGSDNWSGEDYTNGG